MPKISPARNGEQLTADEIVDAAISLSKKVGFGTFSIPQLGEELAVTGMAVYYYFKSKDAIVQAAADRVMARVHYPDPSLAWDERILDFSRRLRSQILAFPGLAEYLLSHALTDEGRKQVELSTDGLIEAGLGRDEAVLANAALYAYSIGQLSIDSAVRSRSKRSSRPEPKSSKRAAPLAVDAEQRFAYATQLWLAGVKAMIASRKGSITHEGANGIRTHPG